MLGLGCNNFGWRIDAAAARAVVDAALDAGITLFDTADVYGEGASEAFVGAALAGRRDRVVLVTKFGLPFPGAPDVPPGSAEYLEWALAGSLRRLRTETVDVLMYHRPDGITPIAETVEALAEPVRRGDVRAVGISNATAEQVDAASAAAKRVGVPFVAVESRYSLLRREVEASIVPACTRSGAGLLPFYPLESGLLTGKYRRGQPPPSGSRFAADTTIWPAERWLTDAVLERVERLERFAEERGRSLLDVAIGGLVAQPAVASVIAGATSAAQVRANARAAGWSPSAAELAALPGP